MLAKKQKKVNKPASIQNSLITIKDFNETMKAERGGRLFSDSKENTLSTHKLNMKDLIKNILEEEVESEHSLEKDHKKENKL